MHKQNFISKGALDLNPLKEREQQVIEDASKKLNFTPDVILKRSYWWNSKHFGAIHVNGKYKGKSAVLKIQVHKVNTSEVFLIESFANCNKSKLIRPPYLFEYLKWSDSLGYEALVLEDVGDNTIVKLPTNREELRAFFEAYKDYRENCLNAPFLDKPDVSLSNKIKSDFDNWIKIRQKLYLKHPFIDKKNDEQLIQTAVEILVREYKNYDYEFMHGHFGANDLFAVGKQVVILSNLYWSWRLPFYDAVFGYHWFMYNLSDINDVSKDLIEAQRDVWMDFILKITKNQNERLLKLALLERATAGLNLDALSVKVKKPIAKFLIEDTRKRVREFIEYFS